jgi:hypothetical protein
MDTNTDPNGEARTAAIRRVYNADEMSERELAIIGLHGAVIFAGINDMEHCSMTEILNRSAAWLMALGVTEDEIDAAHAVSTRMIVAARDSG